MAVLFVPLFHSDGQIGIGKERACRLGLPCPSWKPYNIRSFLFICDIIYYVLINYKNYLYKDTC